MRREDRTYRSKLSEAGGNMTEEGYVQKAVRMMGEESKKHGGDLSHIDAKLLRGAPQPDKKRSPQRVGRTSDEKRLLKAGWRKTRKGWKSPYTGNVLNEEKAVRTELLMAGEASPTDQALRRGEETP